MLQAAVHCVKFNPKGDWLASSVLWNTYDDCKNWAVMKGHTGTVLELQWGRDGDRIFTASADKTGAVFDVESGERIKRFRTHQLFVNSIATTRRGTELALTGSDDCTAQLWDLRSKHSQTTLKHQFQVTAVSFSDDGAHAFTGGIDNAIHCWDLRKPEAPVYSLEGHADSITGMELNPAGTHLLTNSMDCTLRSWDVRPYVSGGRLAGVFQGLQHDFQKQLLRCAWSPDGSRVSSGSADRFVYVWEVATGRVLYKLPGHAGCVNEVDFHPSAKEPIIASAGNDKQIFLGEIAPSV